MSKPTEVKPNLLEVYEIEQPKKKAPRSHVRVFLIIASVVIILAGALGATAGALQAYYQDRFLPHVVLAGINVGGLTHTEASQILQQAYNAMIEQGLEVELYNQVTAIELSPEAATDPDLVYQLIDVDIAALVDQGYRVGRSGNPATDFFAPLYYATLGQAAYVPEPLLAETRLSAAIRESYPDAESPGTPTAFAITEVDETVNITIVDATTGSTIDYRSAFAALERDAQDLKLNRLELQLVERTAIISSEDAATLIPAAVLAVENAPYTLTYTNDLARTTTYPVTVEAVKLWLIPTVDDNGLPTLGLDAAAMESLLTDIHTDLDISPQDAKFVVEGNRVIEFSPSRNGLLVNDDILLDDLVLAFTEDADDVLIPVEVSLPAIPTESANDLGIKEPLGVGYSSFKGSPSNRRANIRHGADKLNGLLIPPGETLSLLEQLRPFTVADGYLPELVIKGDEIIPEIGGGLCQIGTTTFRAAMNSGLDIAERRNHSLVVSYYNDPSNNQPGTDATIYDPAPDLKIANDTEHYIMLVTEVDSTTNELFFTFWGTSDGRKGSYTPPVVLSWTGTGPAIEKPTASLPVGTRSCQASHPGASTTFDYTVVRPDGTEDVRTFASTYRALPAVCLVGTGGASQVEGATDGLAEDASAN